MSASSDPGVADAATAEDNGVRLRIRLTPRARRTAVEGLAPARDGGAEIRAAVTAVPENGEANRALIRLLAETWRVPRTAVSVVSGASARRKVVRIAGDPADLMERIRRTFNAQGPSI